MSRCSLLTSTPAVALHIAPGSFPARCAFTLLSEALPEAATSATLPLRSAQRGGADTAAATLSSPSPRSAADRTLRRPAQGPLERRLANDVAVHARLSGHDLQLPAVAPRETAFRMAVRFAAGLQPCGRACRVGMDQIRSRPAAPGSRFAVRDFTRHHLVGRGAVSRMHEDRGRAGPHKGWACPSALRPHSPADQGRSGTGMAPRQPDPAVSRSGPDCASRCLRRAFVDMSAVR